MTPQRVLALTPFYRGTGFVVLGTGRRILGYGMKRGGGADARERFIQQATHLMQYYRPTALVVEDWTVPACRRGQVIREQLHALWDLATREQIPIHRFSRAAVTATFAPQRKRVTKQQMVSFLISLFPEIAHKQPPVRKSWMGEDPRMYLFDALALALVCAVHAN